MSTWVPESKRTPAWALFNTKFHCRVSNIQSMSIDYMQEVGLPAIGDRRYDQEMANELIDRMLTINEMVEFHKKGVTVRVVKYDDTKKIYELISNHLIAWKNQLENGANTRGAPIDDLILLDQFANVVYKHAKYQFTTDMVDSILARQMSSRVRGSRTNLLRSATKNVVVDDKNQVVEVPKYPERQSLDAAFKQYHRGGSGIATGAKVGTSKWK